MIEINKEYKISVDSYCFILNELDKETGEFEEVSYYTDLHGLLKGFARRYKKKRKPETYTELVELENEIASIIKRKKNITVSRLRDEYMDLKNSKSEEAKKRLKK